MSDKLHRGEPADASGLPFGTENPANTTAAQGSDKPAPDERQKQRTGDPTLSNRENETGVESPEELNRRSAYERGPQ
jgi:hypothetical protein